MSTIEYTQAKNKDDIEKIAALADEIWNEHFPPIIGQDQVDYMVEKYQSESAITSQIEEDGYEYYMIWVDQDLAGYMGVKEEDGALFLSKFYIHERYRGQHLATTSFHFLTALCKERGLNKIWLTCNKHNNGPLAIYDHLGFKVTSSQVTDIGSGFVMDDYVLTYPIETTA